LVITAIAVLGCVGFSVEWFQDDATTPKHGGAFWKPLISATSFDAVIDCEAIVIVDVRSQEAYLEGHIPGSINLPVLMLVSGWIVSDELLMELPPVDDLEDMLSEAGISHDSKIVLISVASMPIRIQLACRFSGSLTSASRLGCSGKGKSHGDFLSPNNFTTLVLDQLLFSFFNSDPTRNASRQHFPHHHSHNKTAMFFLIK
jgi:rhodanese-related sulfurtransferase